MDINRHALVLSVCAPAKLKPFIVVKAELFCGLFGCYI